MLENRRVNIILALIVAITLWAYVLGDVNPETNITVKNVPITFTNQEALEESGLTILNSNVESINISISGQRTAVTKVKPSDFNVTADVEALKMGENTVRLDITGPGSIKIENTNYEKISVVIDKKVTESKDVKVIVNNETDAEKEAHVIEVNRETVEVTGAKTLVDRVEQVNASVEASAIEGTATTLETTLIPVDQKGAQVERLRLEHSKAKVTAVMFNKKTVSLEVPVTNVDKGNVERTVTTPKTIVIKGTEEDLENISKITCETLDVGEVYQTTKIEVKPILPNGIQVSKESVGLSASITVKSMETTSFNFDEGDINISGKKNDLNYKISPIDFQVKAIGKGNIVSNILTSDFSISVDVENLGKGTHTVTLKITCAKETLSIESSTENVEITIE